MNLGAMGKLRDELEAQLAATEAQWLEWSEQVEGEAAWRRAHPAPRLIPPASHRRCWSCGGIQGPKELRRQEITQRPRNFYVSLGQCLPSHESVCGP
jgi:hypothetical protein